MKLSPLILFLLIISVLLISLLFSRYLPIEGFIDFNYSAGNKDAIGLPDNTIIPIYSPDRRLVRLYDNLYFDCKNAYIIEIDGPLLGADVTTGKTDITATTITGTYVTTRDNKTNATAYPTTINSGKIEQKATTEASKDSVTDSKLHFIYNTKASTTGASKYQLLYIANGANTYIHIVDVTTKTGERVNLKHLGTYLSTGCESDESKVYATEPAMTSPNTANSTLVADSNNDKDGIKETPTVYDETHTLYQLSGKVKFDVKNGNLIIKKAPVSGATTPVVEIYSRNGTKLDNVNYKTQSGYAGPIANVAFNSFIVEDDTTSSNSVLYIASAQKTVVAILQKTATGYSIGSVKRFNASGLDETVTAPETTPATTPATPPATDASGNGNVYSEYYKWLAFWNATAQGNGSYSDDYMLKTNVVPPVCPTCPSCHSCGTGGVCANCGGNGGSGTLSSDGSSVAGGTLSGSATPGSVNASGSLISGSGTGQLTTQGRGTYATTADTNTLGGATTVQTLGVVSGVENVAQTGADVISGTVGTVGGLAGQALSTTGGLLYAGGSGAVNLAKSTGSGAVDLVKSAGSGTANLLTGGRQGYYGYDGYSSQPSGNQRTAVPTGSPTTGMAPGYNPNYNDNYSRYGALQSRGSSNYIPITADFSKFGR